MVKFNRGGLILLLACLALSLALATDAQNIVPSDASAATDEPTSSRGGFFSALLRPITGTLRKARQLFSSGVGTLNEGADQVRLQTFKIFMSLYNKTYSPEEIPKRMALFFERRKLIEESVKSFEQGTSMFVMRENMFVDWDDDEIKKLAGVSLPEPKELDKEQMEAAQQEEQTASDSSLRLEINVRDDEPMVGSGAPGSDDGETGLRVRAQIPVNKDWRESGCIAKPVNQLKCGACYAIATMGVVEAMHCINRVSSPTLSSQQVVDCSTPRAGYQNYGCDGGWPTRVLKYLQDVNVVSRESCYPFVRRQNTCKLKSMQSTEGCTMNASPTDRSRIQYKVLNNERDMLYHVATTGPIVGVLQASDKFLYYGKGIFDDPRCTRKRDDVDHAIQLVGYGNENGVDYWLVKNSWGTTTWGENGYGKLKRGTNACSIGYFGWVVTG